MYIYIHIFYAYTQNMVFLLSTSECRSNLLKYTTVVDMNGRSPNGFERYKKCPQKLHKNSISIIMASLKHMLQEWKTLSGFTSPKTTALSLLNITQER